MGFRPPLPGSSEERNESLWKVPSGKSGFKTQSHTEIVLKASNRENSAPDTSGAEHTCPSFTVTANQTGPIGSDQTGQRTGNVRVW